MIPDAQPPAERVSSRYKRLRKVHPELAVLSGTPILEMLNSESRAAWRVPRVIFGGVLATLASGYSFLVFGEFVRFLVAWAPSQATSIRACLWSLGAFVCVMPWALFVRLITYQIPNDNRSRPHTYTTCAACQYSLAASPISQDGTTTCPECGLQNVRLRHTADSTQFPRASVRSTKSGRWMTLSRPWRAIPELDGVSDADCLAIMSTARSDLTLRVTMLGLNVAAGVGVLVSLYALVGLVGRLHFEFVNPPRMTDLLCAAWLGMVLCSLPAIVMFRIRDLALRKKIRSLLRNGVTPETQQFASLATPCPAGDAP